MKDSGAAFPVHTLMHDKKTGEFLGISCYGGMTLRDYFAGQALASNTGFMGNGNYEVLAAECYVLADAMLAEREKQDD